MKKTIILTLCFLFCSAIVSAAPYLVVNAPDAAEQVQGYNVYFNGERVVTTPLILHSSGAAIVMDLAEVQDVFPLGATYNIETKAWNAAGESAAAPFQLVLPASVPTLPSTIRLEQ